jgi:hypothetical protein
MRIVRELTDQDADVVAELRADLLAGQQVGDIIGGDEYVLTHSQPLAGGLVSTDEHRIVGRHPKAVANDDGLPAAEHSDASAW